MASPLPTPRLGGSQAAGTGTAKVNASAKKLGPATTNTSRNEMPVQFVGASASVPHGELDYQMLWNSQSPPEASSDIPPPVPKHQGRAYTVKYAELDHSGQPTGRQSSPSPALRQKTAYSQIDRIISGEDGTEISIPVGNGHETSSDEDFDYDVPPSITVVKQQKSDDRHSPSLSPEDVYNVPHFASPHELSPFSSDPAYDIPPPLSQSELQSHRAPPLPAKVYRAPPPVPQTKPLYDHVNPTNCEVDDDPYDHPPLNNQNDNYDHPYFRQHVQSSAREEEREYEQVAPDESAPPPVPCRPLSQFGLPQFPVRASPVMSVYKASTTLTHGIPQSGGGSNESRQRSGSSAGHSQREVSIHQLMKQGYSRDRVVRALAVSHNDFKMAERILKEFGN